MDAIFKKIKEIFSRYSIYSFIPFIDNEDVITLQFNGWVINLNSDGTWDSWEDTTGG